MRTLVRNSPQQVRIAKHFTQRQHGGVPELLQLLYSFLWSWDGKEIRKEVTPNS